MADDDAVPASVTDFTTMVPPSSSAAGADSAAMTSADIQKLAREYVMTGDTEKKTQLAALGKKPEEKAPGALSFAELMKQLGGDKGGGAASTASAPSGAGSSSKTLPSAVKAAPVATAAAARNSRTNSGSDDDYAVPKISLAASAKRATIGGPLYGADDDDDMAVPKLNIPKSTRSQTDAPSSFHTGSASTGMALIHSPSAPAFPFAQSQSNTGFTNANGDGATPKPVPRALHETRQLRSDSEPRRAGSPSSDDDLGQASGLPKIRQYSDGDAEEYAARSASPTQQAQSTQGGTRFDELQRRLANSNAGGNVFDRLAAGAKRTSMNPSSSSSPPMPSAVISGGGGRKPSVGQGQGFLSVTTGGGNSNLASTSPLLQSELSPNAALRVSHSVDAIRLSIAGNARASNLKVFDKDQERRHRQSRERVQQRKVSATLDTYSSSAIPILRGGTQFDRGNMDAPPSPKPSAQQSSAAGRGGGGGGGAFDFDRASPAELRAYAQQLASSTNTGSAVTSSYGGASLSSANTAAPAGAGGRSMGLSASRSEKAMVSKNVDAEYEDDDDFRKTHHVQEDEDDEAMPPAGPGPTLSFSPSKDGKGLGLQQQLRDAEQAKERAREEIQAEQRKRLELQAEVERLKRVEKDAEALKARVRSQEQILQEEKRRLDAEFDVLKRARDAAEQKATEARLELLKKQAEAAQAVESSNRNSERVKALQRDIRDRDLAFTEAAKRVALLEKQQEETFLKRFVEIEQQLTRLKRETGMEDEPDGASDSDQKRLIGDDAGGCCSGRSGKEREGAAARRKSESWFSCGGR